MLNTSTAVVAQVAPEECSNNVKLSNLGLKNLDGSYLSEYPDNFNCTTTIFKKKVCVILEPILKD